MKLILGAALLVGLFFSFGAVVLPVVLDPINHAMGLPK